MYFSMQGTDKTQVALGGVSWRWSISLEFFPASFFAPQIGMLICRARAPIIFHKPSRCRHPLCTTCGCSAKLWHEKITETSSAYWCSGCDRKMFRNVSHLHISSRSAFRLRRSSSKALFFRCSFLSEAAGRPHRRNFGMILTKASHLKHSPVHTLYFLSLIPAISTSLYT